MKTITTHMAYQLTCIKHIHTETASSQPNQTFISYHQYIRLWSAGRESGVLNQDINLRHALEARGYCTTVLAYLVLLLEYFLPVPGIVILSSLEWNKEQTKHCLLYKITYQRTVVLNHVL